MKSLSSVIRKFSSSKDLQKTALHTYHKQINGKMVPFAGYELPVQYKDGIMKEHLHCRDSASLFDVSHMGQIKIRGENRVDFVEKLIVGNIRDQNNNNGFLSLILNNKAGIIDDTIVTPMEDHIHMVVNGANKVRDLEHFAQVQQEFFSDADINIEYQEGRQLIAFQGPKAYQVLQRFVEQDLNQFIFMDHHIVNFKPLGIEILLCRCGYTGEDGFELSIAPEHTEKVFDILLNEEEVKVAGLGARDSLRTEAGLCLHGNDMTEDLTPANCTLMWTVRKGGKGTSVKYPFIGRQALTKQRKEGVDLRRVGFALNDKGVVRPPLDVFDDQGQKIGFISTGTYSPSLGKSIGMAFVPAEYTKAGSQIIIQQRKKEYKATVTKTPFVPAKYVK